MPWIRMQLPSGEKTEFPTLNYAPTSEQSMSLMGMGSFRDRFQNVCSEFGMSIQYDRIFSVFCVCEQLWVVDVFDTEIPARIAYQIRLSDRKGEKK